MAEFLKEPIWWDGLWSMQSPGTACRRAQFMPRNLARSNHTQWADRHEGKHRVAIGRAQSSCPRPVTGLPGMGHFQRNYNWENTQQVKNWKVFGHHPPVLTSAMKLLSLCYFVEWKIYPLQVFVMCHISQPGVQADLPAEDLIAPLERRRD